MAATIILAVMTSAAWAQKPVQGKASGKLSMFLAQDVGSGYGAPDDRVDGEVVIRLDTQPQKAFGFQLRNDNYLPARRAMLDLLRDAFEHNWTVVIEYDMIPGKNAGVIWRIFLVK
jgi:hypothetical protein